MARPVGFEPTTHRLEICCSIQLSYGRVWLDCANALVINFKTTFKIFAVVVGQIFIVGFLNSFFNTVCLDKDMTILSPSNRYFVSVHC